MDLRTGLKIKSTFTRFERSQSIQQLNQAHGHIVDELGLTHNDLSLMFTTIQQSQLNGQSYHRTYHPDLNQQKFLKIFYWVVGKLREYR